MSNSGYRLISSRPSFRARANVRSIVHAFKANLGRSGIRGRKSRFQVGPIGGDAENPASAGDDVTALAARAGMQDLHTSI
jgi:hypothetical protein